MKLKIFIVFLLMLTSIYSASALLYVVAGNISSSSTPDIIYKSVDEAYYQPIFDISNPQTYMTTLLSNVPQMINSEITKIESSNDGRFIYAVAVHNVTTSYILKSDDSGASFHVIYSDTFSNFSGYVIPFNVTDFDVSGDGKYVYISTSNYTGIYTSNDYGSSFTLHYVPCVVNVGAKNSLSTSYTGQSVAYGCGGNYLLGDTDSYWYYSSDYGQTYTQYISINNNGNYRSWDSCMSQTGQYIYLKQSETSNNVYYLFYSLNYGVSWSNVTAGTRYSSLYDDSIICMNDSNVMIYSGFVGNTTLHNATAEQTNLYQGVAYLVSDENHFDRAYFEKGSSFSGLDGILYVAYGNNEHTLFNNVSMIYNFSSRGVISDILYIPIPYNATTEYPPVCLDESSYCSNPFYLLPDTTPKCSYSDIQYCSGGCIDDICHVTVESDCNVVGSRKCVDSTIYAVCSDSDLNGALDYGEVHNCAVGQFCFESFNFASCENVTTTGTHSPYNIFLTPYAVNNDGTLTEAVYTIDTTNRVLNVLTNKTIHTQRFYNSGVSYIARSCDYRETVAYSYNTPIYTSNQDYVFNSATASTTVVRLSLLPDNVSNSSITITSQGGTVDSRIYIVRNSTDKRVTILKSDESVLYDNYDVTSADTLRSVDLEYTFDMSTSYYSLKILFNRDSDETKIVYPIAFVGDNIYNVSVQSSEGNITVNSVQAVTIPQPNTWTATYNTSEYIQNCEYLTSGTYKVRTYANAEVSPDYESYTDYTIIVKFTDEGTSLNQNGVDVFGSNLSKTTKYIIVLLACLVMIGSFTALGYSIGMIQASFIIGVVSAVFLLLIFTVLGWIPPYIIVLMVVISVAVAILLSKSPSGNDGTG